MSDLLNRLEGIKELKERIEEQLSHSIVGQKSVVEDLLTAIIGGGHVLMVGVPGLAKTLMITTIAQLLGLDYKRVQFTPDLMPSDIIGTEIITENRSSGEKSFKFIQGPLFTNLLLADEINRTPPKTQSALLQAMQEKEVSIGNETVKLDEPFFVLATQNPIEQEGTYPLPEAQLDRFIFSLKVEYPSLEEEIEIIKRGNSGGFKQPVNVISKEEILAIRELLPQIPVTDNIVEYAVGLVRSSRPSESSSEFVKESIRWGAGPRAGQSLILAGKISAILNGNLSPNREDINRIAKQVLRHRVLPSFKAEAEGITSDHIIEKLIEELN